MAQVVIFHMPIATHDAAPRLLDKLVHVLAYGALAVLAALVARPWLNSGGGPGGGQWLRSWSGVALLLAAYGLLDEATQPLTGRGFAWLDWGADLVGIAAGLVAVAIARRVWN